jgi:DNA-binding SARP family transcriptional activator
MENRSTMTDLTELFAAVEHAIANFTGEDDIDTDVVELVAGLVKEAVEEADAGRLSYARNLVEKASTYVQTDLDELEMNDWVGEVDTQLEEYGIGCVL